MEFWDCKLLVMRWLDWVCCPMMIGLESFVRTRIYPSVLKLLNWWPDLRGCTGNLLQLVERVSSCDMVDRLPTLLYIFQGATIALIRSSCEPVRSWSPWDELKLISFPLDFVASSFPKLSTFPSPFHFDSSQRTHEDSTNDTLACLHASIHQNRSYRSRTSHEQDQRNCYCFQSTSVPSSSRS
jgi:hypothetical protein